MTHRINPIAFLFLLLATLALRTIPAAAQDTSGTIGRVNIASPTAASLGKYGDIPVSYHTGIPEIQVPIYTVNAGSLKLPISLGYHASGLKVEEPASWVGAGWSLNAGGAIVRTVMGSPDDRGYSTSNVWFGYYTDMGFESYLNIGNTGPGGQADDVQFARGTKDGEPDLYFFNFAGISGKFYFNDDRTPVMVPEQDIRIQPFVQTGQGFIGFIITTSDGTRYYFGQVGNNGTVSPVESTNPFTIQNGPSNTTAASSSWFLNKIVSGDGVDSITFSYKQENYSYYTISTYPVLSTNYNRMAADYSLQNGMNFVKNLVQGVRLNQIAFPGGTVNFTAAASPRQDLSYSYGLLVSNTMADNANTSSFALGSISISDNAGFCKKDSFYTSYFYDATALPSNFFSYYSAYNIHSDQYRLRLDSVQETSCDATVKVPPYRFTYFSEKVPRMLSFGMDHWGYANASDTNTTLVPQLTKIVNGSPIIIGGSYRDAVWPAMRGGALQKISYPTGGNTQFDFEPKNIYTFNNSVLNQIHLQGYVIAEYGQAQLSQTLNFTTAGSGAVVITINNHSSAWSPSFTIKDAGNNLVAGTPWTTGPNSTLTQTINLVPGTYTGTLYYPSNAGDTLVAGADATVWQWQYVTQTSNLTVGGLRIKTITSSESANTTPIVTSYTYPAGGSNTTGGTLYSFPVYIQILRSDINKLVWGDLPNNQYCSPNGCWSCDMYNEHVYYVSPSSVQPMNSLQGENVGYDEVDVTQTGNGKSVYRYYGSNLWNQPITDVCQRSIVQTQICDLTIPNFPFPPLPFEFMREELKYEGHFNDAGQILKEKYYFPTYAADPMTTPGHISVDMPYIYTYTEYSRQSAKKIKDSVISNQYDQTTGTMLSSTDVSYYNSLYHHKPTRKIMTTSTGDSLAVNTKYAFDFRLTGCDGAIPDSLAYYLNAFHADTLWLNSTINSCSPQVNNTNNCRWSTFGTYREMMMRDRLNFIAYRRRSFAADTANLLSTCCLNALPGADPLLKPLLRLQNMYDNAPIEVSEWKNLNLRHATFTQYDTSMSPIGFAYPGRTQVVNLLAPSATFTASVVSGSTITKDSRYLDESTFKFSIGNPQQVTPHSGLSTSYVWDYLNKEPVAKVVNATFDQVAYTSFEADGNGSWTIPSTNRDHANAITGTSSYNLTNGAISRSGLMSSASYVVSYWSKTGGAYSVTGSVSVIQGKTINGWTYFEHTVTGTASVSVSGGGDIDELRLYPGMAQMTTYTYSPLMGMTSQCDMGNRITYYSYDPLGRLRFIKDQDGNIIKTIEYHYKSN